MKILWLLAAGLATVLSAPLQAETPRADTPGMVPAQPGAAQQLAAAILASVRTNDERAQGIELTITKDFFDRSVAEDGPEEIRLPSGGLIVTQRRQRAQSIERAVLLDKKLRLETGGNGVVPPVVYVTDGVRWTRSTDLKQEVSMMRTEQLGGRVFDPREVVGIDATTTLSDLLSPQAIQNSPIQTDGTISTLTAEHPGGRVEMQFDSARSLLPVRSRWFHPDGGLVRDAQATYQWLSDRNAWMIKSLTEHYYDLSSNTKVAPAEWKQEMKSTFVSTPIERAAAEAQLAVVIPEGFHVNDHTLDSTRNRQLKPKPPTPAAPGFSWIWFLLAHAALLACGAGYLLWRRHRASPAQV